VQGFDKLGGVEPLATLTAAQRELLDQAIRDHPDLVASGFLVVYRLKGGGALVAPQTEEIAVGDPLIHTGGWTATLSTASSDADSPDADLSVALGVADATRWLEPAD
jgi:hypothetical protein